jgi:hypothetical protein
VPGRSDKYGIMTAAPGEVIPHLLETAKALRHARRMQQEFMLRWALQRAGDQAESADDASPFHGHDDLFDCKQDPHLADTKNRDWRDLYRGSVLDD